MDLTEFKTAEELKAYVENQKDPEEATEQLSEQYQEGIFDGKPQKYIVYTALALMDEFPMGGSIQTATLEKKWNITDDDGEKQTTGYNDDGAMAVVADVKAAFLDLTGVEAGGPDKEGDTEIEYDEEGKIIGMEDWWINDGRDGRWLVVIDEWPYFNFEPQ